jgi:predicted permease
MVLRGWTRLRDRLRGLLWQLRGALRGRASDLEQNEEQRFHVEMETDRLVRGGVTHAEARRRALVAFGGVERVSEEVRQARWTWWLEEVWRDTRHAARWLVRRPLFTVVSAGTMAVAIGAATALFSLVYAVLLRPLPVPSPDELVSVQFVAASGRAQGVVSLPDYVDYRAGATGAVDLAAHHLSDVALSADGSAQAGLGFDVSGNYFSVLGVTPALGRFFTGDGVNDAGAAAEVVLSHAFWQGRYGGDAGVLGGTLHVNGQPLTIVGVAPQGFHGAMLAVRPEIWLPLGQYGRLQGTDIVDRTASQWLQLFGRQMPGATAQGTTAVLTTLAGRLAAAHDYHEDVAPARAEVQTFSGLPLRQRGAARMFMLLVLAASTVLLLVAAVNVAGMLLARTSRRAREIAVRLALGAGRPRVARQFVLEALLLGWLGWMAGVALAGVGTRLLGRVQPAGMSGFQLDVALNATVLGFALAAAMGSSLIFGLVPAWHATRRDLVEGMQRTTGTRRSGRARSVLVASQVALTVVLLVGTALLVRTLQNALATEHGFDPGPLIVAELNLSLNGYDASRGSALYAALLDRLRASQDVEAAALATSIPLGFGSDQTRASLPGAESPDRAGTQVLWSAVSDGYFETLGLPLLMGGEPSMGGGAHRIVVNQTLAERFWPDATPLGQRLRFSGREAEVSGVAPSGKYRSWGEPATPFAWVPFAAEYHPAAYVHVRPRGSAAAAVAELRRTLAGLDPYMPLIHAGPLDAVMGQSLFLQRSAAALIGGFAAVALLLSAAGIFGLIALTVEQRRREIGIRMAIGASGPRIVRAVVAGGLRAVLIGLAAGLLLALLSTRVLSGLLYDVASNDPASFATAGLVILAAALLAAYLPARRAARLRPAETLRAD